MDAIEKAIRNAFEKGNAEDRAFREKVYRSAFAALDRALQANPGVTVETAIKRRKAMQAKIAEIESEFLPAIAAAPTLETPGISPYGSAAPSVDAPRAPSSDASAPQVIIPSAPSAPSAAGRAEPQFASPAGSEPHQHGVPVVPDIIPEGALPESEIEKADRAAAVAPDRDDRRARRRRFPTTATFLGVTILALIGIGLWWAVQTGAFKTLEELGQPPVPPPTVEDDDYTPPADASAPQKPGDADQERNWVTVFSPKDPTLVSTPSDASSEVMEDDTGQFLRIRSGSSGSSISFDVGQGVLEQVAGKHAVFDIVARAEDGKDTQISVDCNFGELGDCGRKRYAVSHERNEYLFDVEMPNKRPGAAGTIAINSDFDKQGKSVDIYEIRVSVSE